jgi:hypothetical protein
MAEADVVRAMDRGPIMSIDEAKDLEKRQAAGCDYYAVFLKNEATDEIIRVRTPVHKLDGERRPIMDGDKKIARNAHEVALDVWAAYGADEHTLEMVLRGGLVVATPASIANEIAMKRIATAE